MFIITSCSVNTSKMDNFDTSNITYVKDSETGLCFAIVATRKSGSTDQSGIGMACVPCSEKVMEKINNEK